MAGVIVLHNMGEGGDFLLLILNWGDGALAQHAAVAETPSAGDLSSGHLVIAVDGKSCLGVLPDQLHLPALGGAVEIEGKLSLFQKIAVVDRNHIGGIPVAEGQGTDLGLL